VPRWCGIWRISVCQPAGAASAAPGAGHRVAIGLIAADGHSIHEELAWAGGFGRCGESERVISCEAFAAEMSAWLATRSCMLEVEIDALAPVWHDCPVTT
jgi:hypothetical protein